MARVHDVLSFARQPIIDRGGRTVAYEVLFRADRRARTAAFRDGTAATRSVLRALDRYGDELFDRRLAFVNLPRQALLDRLVGDLDPGRIGCEVLEDVRPDPHVVAALDELRAAGFTVSLDDFGPELSRQGLIAHADIVKLDVRQFDVAGLRPVVSRLQGLGVRVVAEKVETVAELERCLGAGFDLFQGYAVGRPVTFPLPSVSRGRVWRRLAAPGRAGMAASFTPRS